MLSGARSTGDPARGIRVAVFLRRRFLCMALRIFLPEDLLICQVDPLAQRITGRIFGYVELPGIAEWFLLVSRIVRLPSCGFYGFISIFRAQRVIPPLSQRLSP